MKPAFLDRIETVIIVENLSMLRNGIANSVLRKVKMMEDAWDYHPLILVAEYNINLKRIDIGLKYADLNDDQISLDPNARIFGVYDYFQKSYQDGLAEVEYGLSRDPSEIYKPIGDYAYEVYQGDTHVRSEFYYGFLNKLRMMDRFSEGKRNRTVFYDDCGCVSMIRQYDRENPQYHPVEYYYTTDRLCRLRSDYDFMDGENQLKRIALLKEDGSVEREFDSNVELTAYCLEQILSDETKTYLLIDEAGLYTKTPLLVHKPNVIKACVVHNIFLEDSNDLNSQPQRFYKHLCEERNAFDGIVFLTMKERADFIRKYPDFDLRKAFVIPHPYPHPVQKTSFEARERKAVLVARFDPFKRIETAIKIVKAAAMIQPDIRLEIYGFGAKEKEYRALIEELDLEENVVIKGFTNDSASVFREALFSVMTSSAEGLPLTLMESVCNGCPVFAFDIKYGPSDVILDGVTGFLFAQNDWESFAAEMIRFWRDEGLQRQMSENCYDDADRFSKDRFLHHWASFMETLYDRHNLHNLNPVNCALTH